MKKILFLTLLIGSLISAELTVKQYLNNIVKNDPAFRQLRYDQESFEGGLLSLMDMYDWRIFAGYEYGYQEPSVIGFSPVENLQTNFYKFGANKKLLNSGTNINASFTKFTQDAPTNKFYRNKPIVSLRVTQPLWQDFLGILSRIPLEKMKIQKEVVKLSQIENMENYFEQAIKLYYDWLSLTLTIKPLQESYENAQKILVEVKNQYALDLVNQSDLLRSEEAVLIYENALNEVIYQWNIIATNIYQKMGQEFKPVIDHNNLPVVPMACNCFEFQKTDLNKIRPLKVLNILIEQLSLDLKVAQQKEKPTLSAYAENSIYKTEDQKTTNLNLSDREYKVGLEFSTSLDNSSGEKIKFATEIKKAKENLQNTANKLTSSFASLLLNLETIQKTQSNAKQIALLSKQRLDLETKRYKNGKTMLNVVADCRNQYAQNQVNYLKKNLEKIILNIKIASLSDQLYPQVEQIIGNLEEMK